MDNNSNKATLALGTEPVGKLLLQYALPAIVAMTASSLYNMIDSIFIGQGVGAMAISGLAITFPFMNLSAAFGAGVGVGASTCLSLKLGQKDYAMAQKIFGNTIVLNLIVGITFAVISLIFLDPILYFFGASENTLPYARDYMLIILLGNVITHMYLGMNAVLRAASKPKVAMNATIFTVVANVVFAPIFIYVFHWGIMGAAFATVLAQAIALAWQMHEFSDKNQILHLEKGIYKLDRHIIGNIIAIGLSPFLMNVCSCILVIIINKGLLEYGNDLAVGAFGIANRICFIFLMITIGINQGMQPIAGYNYGAMKIDRLLRVLKLAIISGTCVTTFGFVVTELFPRACVSLFTTDQELIELSINALQIIMVTMPIVGSQMVITNFFQSIGKAKVSIFLSLCRQLLFLLPLLLTLPHIFGLNGVLYSIPGSDLIATITTVTMLIVYMKKFRKQYKEYITDGQR